MRFAIVLFFLSLLPQDPATRAERIILTSREELQGEIEGYRREGVLSIRDAGRSRAIPVADVSRVYFETAPAITPTTGERLLLNHGGQLTGATIAFAEGSFSIVTPTGKYALARNDVRSVNLAPLDGALPEFKEEKLDLLLWKGQGDDEKAELKAAYGSIFTLDGDKVTLKEPKGAIIEVPRASCRVLYLYHPAKASTDLATGWFAKVLLKNGDKLIGNLRAIEKAKVVLFSHFLGQVEFPKSAIHSLTFVQFARMSVGNLLVCEQNGVRELDRTGKEIWRYQGNISYPWAARKLENGNVLIANTNYNQIIEVKPSAKSGGEVVWQLDNVNYPYDVQRLANGNTLVAEYYANRAAEYEPKGKSIVWQTTKCNYPISAQRLENGNTLLCSNNLVVEVTAKHEEKWRASGVRPWRAERLEDGNTLIVDMQRNTVLVLDSKSREVWKKDGLSRPTAAIRLDDGNTLILEQGKQQITEVDPTGKQVSTITGLNFPLHVSTY